MDVGDRKDLPEQPTHEVDAACWFASWDRHRDVLVVAQLLDVGFATEDEHALHGDVGGDESVEFLNEHLVPEGVDEVLYILHSCFECL